MEQELAAVSTAYCWEVGDSRKDKQLDVVHMNVGMTMNKVMENKLQHELT